MNTLVEDPPDEEADQNDRIELVRPGPRAAARRGRRGAERAFRKWYEKDSVRVVKAMTIETGDRQQGRELALEACALVREHWLLGRPPKDPTTWAVVNGFRLYAKAPRRSHAPRNEPPTDDWLLEAIHQLPAQVRHAVTLRHVVGLRPDRIGTALGVTTGTAAALLAQGRARLAPLIPRPDSS